MKYIRSMNTIHTYEEIKMSSEELKSRSKTMSTEEYDSLIDNRVDSLFATLDLFSENINDARDMLEDIYSDVNKKLKQKYGR